MNQVELAQAKASVELCTLCGSFPCVCGKQYKPLDDKHLILLLIELEKICRERNLKPDFTLHSKDLTHFYQDENDQLRLSPKKTLLDYLGSEEDLPVPFVELMKKYKTAQDLYKELPSLNFGYKSVLLYAMVSLLHDGSSLRKSFCNFLEKMCKTFPASVIQLLREQPDKTQSILFQLSVMRPAHKTEETDFISGIAVYLSNILNLSAPLTHRCAALVNLLHKIANIKYESSWINTINTCQKKNDFFLEDYENNLCENIQKYFTGSFDGIEI